MILGGQAAIYYGVRRSTGDMDILVRPTVDNGKKVMAAFRALALQVDDIQPEEFEAVLFLSLGFEPDAVDIFTVTPAVDFDGAFQRAIEIHDDGMAVRIISLEDLIKNKENLHREGAKKLLDEYDVQVLRRIARGSEEGQ